MLLQASKGKLGVTFLFLQALFDDQSRVADESGNFLRASPQKANVADVDDAEAAFITQMLVLFLGKQRRGAA